VEREALPELGHEQHPQRSRMPEQWREIRRRDDVDGTGLAHASPSSACVRQPQAPRCNRAPSVASMVESQGVGNRESGIGNRKSGTRLRVAALTIPYSLLPIPCLHLTPCISLLISGASRNSSTPPPSRIQKPEV